MCRVAEQVLCHRAAGPRSGGQDCDPSMAALVFVLGDHGCQNSFQFQGGLVVAWRRGAVGWRGLLTSSSGFKEATSSKEGNFATAVGSAVGHLSLSPVVDRGYAKYHLRSTIEFPLPARISTESGCAVSTLLPHCTPSPLACLCMGNHLGIRFNSCQLHSIQGEVTVIYLVISVLL